MFLNGLVEFVMTIIQCIISRDIPGPGETHASTQGGAAWMGWAGKASVGWRAGLWLAGVCERRAA